MIILGKWLGRMRHKIQEHRNNKAEIMRFRGANGEEKIYLEINCVKWEKNLLEFKDKVT